MMSQIHRWHPWRMVALTLLMLGALAGADGAHAQSVPVTSGLRIWLDAKDVTAGGTQPSNGATVTEWRDRSGNGFHMSASGTAVTYESTGLGGQPSLRMSGTSKFSVANIFPGSTAAQMTIFIVHANVTQTASYPINLNGDNSSSGATGRVTMHLPFSDAKFYFDAGGCCTTRISGNYPVTVTTPVIIAGGNSTTDFSGFTSVKQFMRFNGTTLASDGTAISPTVSGGLRLGSTTTGTAYNGRFSEVIVYDRALNATEIGQVECYLAAKWSITISACTPVTFTTVKTSAGYSGNTLGDFMIPGNDVVYTITATFVSGSAMDDNSMLIIDELPSTVRFYNGDFNGAGPGTDPIIFTDNNSEMLLNYATNVGYTQRGADPASFAECTYTPTSGYDDNVGFICINPQGSLKSGSFSIEFRAQVK